MRKGYLLAMILASAVYLLCSGCNKKESDDDNNSTPPPSGNTWNLNVSVDLGGSFAVVATAVITESGSTFSAAVTTSQIGGTAESHQFTLNGTINSGTYTMTNCAFSINSGGGTENITITTGTHTSTGTTLSGSGSVSVLPAGSATPLPGTYTVTGSR